MRHAGTRRALGWATVGGFGLVLALGCAAQQQLSRLSPGVYRIECKESLAQCLVVVQDVCRAHGYDVISASEKRNYVEQAPQGYEAVTATATVRCREAVPLFGPDPNTPLAVASASAAASSAPAPSVAPPPAPVAGAASAAAASPSAAAAAPPAPAPPPPDVDGGVP